jgi:hypothetical protein
LKWLPVIAAALEFSPIQKVNQMLQEMHDRGTADLQAEQVAWSKFSQFCEDTQSQKTSSIEKQTQEIENLVAQHGEFKEEAAEHGRQAQQHDKTKAAGEADLKDLIAERKSGHEAYLAEHRDFSESVDAIERALMVLKQQNYDRKQAQSFLQTDETFEQQLAKIPKKAQVLLQAYMTIKDDGDFIDRSNPEANAYEFQSGGIIGMLEKLEADFKTKVSECEKGEANAVHFFELSQLDLRDIIEQNTQGFNKSSNAMNKAKSNAARTKKELGSAREQKAEDEKFLSDLKTECNHKQLSFTEKQKLRQDELDALAKAIEILGNPNIAVSADKRTFFVQTTSPWAIRVSELLSRASEKFGDKQLALMAEKAQKDPFKKVKKMISTMINRLLEEANAEAEKKGFCDKELKVNKQVREKLSAQMQSLAAELDLTNAANQKNSEEIAQLQKDISLLDEQRAEAVDTRNKEKAQNEKTIKESKAAQIAVGQARNVIAEFYAKASQATAFVQLSRPTMGSAEWNALANPDAVKASGYGQGSEDKVDEGHLAGQQTFGDTYSGQQDSAGGVLSMLSIIASDFSNLQADTEAQEAQSQREHDQFMTDTKRDKAVKSKNVDMKTSDLAAGKAKAHSLKQDWNGTDDEMRAANRYFDQLKPQCIVTVSYEERVKRREEEIESLKEALQILNTAQAI